MHSKRSPMPSRWAVNLARQWASNVNATVPPEATNSCKIPQSARGWNIHRTPPSLLHCPTWPTRNTAQQARSKIASLSKVAGSTIGIEDQAVRKLGPPPVPRQHGFNFVGAHSTGRFFPSAHCDLRMHEIQGAAPPKVRSALDIEEGDITG